MKHIAKFSQSGVFYRAELIFDSKRIRYRVSEVAPPMKKRYRYFKVTVVKSFPKVRTYYKKVFYDDIRVRHDFLGRINNKAVFSSIGRLEHVTRFYKVRMSESYIKTKTYTKIKRKRIFVPRSKFHEFRNSFEFETVATSRYSSVLSPPYIVSEDRRHRHQFLYLNGVRLRSYEGTKQWGVVHPDPPLWFTIDRMGDDEPLYGVVPESLGYCELIGSDLDSLKLRQFVFKKFTSLNAWVKKNGLSDSTKRFLSDELNNLPFSTPLKLPFFNRQDQIYAIDESSGVIGFNRGLSALRADYINHFKTNVHGATFLGESPETFKMFLEIIQKLAKVLIFAKKGDFGSALSTLGLTSKKGVASDWLMLQYGIKPLISDLKTLAEEASRKDTKFFKFRFREFREYTLSLPMNFDMPLIQKFESNAYKEIVLDDQGLYELDADCYNLSAQAYYDELEDWGALEYTLPPMPHTYERLNNPASDWDPDLRTHTYLYGIYQCFWCKRMDFTKENNLHLEKYKRHFKDVPGTPREFLLQRNYVLRTRTPTQYKWWEVLKLNELDLTAWELVPFSFVFDWFVPIGNYLEERASLRAVPKNIKFDLTIKDIVTDKQTGIKYSRCDRMRDIDSTTSAFLNLESISWDPLGSFSIGKLLNAAALLQQLKK